jgi:uncharacterized membrane protein YagU involved in acid resistance
MWLRSNVGGSAGQRISGGVLGGMAGGLVFGAMMGMMGMMGMIANIVGSDSAGAGFLYHMFNSAVIGAIFGLVLGTLSHTYDGRGAGLGLLYGAMGWVLGPLVLMPLMMGMGGPQFGMALSPPMVMSLMGHLIFGLLTGLAYAAYAHGRAGVAREA